MDTVTWALRVSDRNIVKQQAGTIPCLQSVGMGRLSPVYILRKTVGLNTACDRPEHCPL